MTKGLAEVLLFAMVAMNTAILAFLAGVLRKVASQMNDAEFQHFIQSLYRYSTRSPFLLAILNLPFFAALPYFFYYGLKNRWITAGLLVWFVGGCAAKVIKVPVYKTIRSLSGRDTSSLRKERDRWDAGNILQATFSSAGTVLMAIAFLR